MREMKDSGVPWIGEIPKEWNLTQLKHSVLCLDGKRIPVDASLREAGPYPYWGAGSITDWVNSYLFDEELVLLGEDGAPFFDPFRPVAHLVSGKIWVNNHIHVLRPRDTVDSRFLVYWLNIVDFHDYINGSILSKLTQSNMDTIRVVRPSIIEQHRIADFLDAKCSEIDSILEKTRASIEEYKKLKQSVITEAVTKGIRGNRPMKDSGVEWIGEIPEDWSIGVVKHVFQRRSHKNDPIVSTERLSLSIGIGITRYEEKTTNLDRFKDDCSQYQLAHEGDIVLNSMNMIVGAVGLSPYFGCVSPVYYVIYPKVEAEIRYWSYLLNCMRIRDVYHSLGQGIYAIERGEGRVNTCRLKVPYEDFERIAIPVLSVKEQWEIANYLDEKCKAIDALIASKEALIGEVEAYKKSLIYEYVTGKKEITVS